VEITTPTPMMQTLAITDIYVRDQRGQGIAQQKARSISWPAS
jgi:hypothetical protein